MTTKMPNLRDSRVKRTRRRLQDALVELILERGYDAVSIRDVARRARVGRSTFYVHFGDLEELFFSIHHDRHGPAPFRKFALQGGGGTFGFSRPFLDHVAEERGVLRALDKTKAGLKMRARFRKETLQMIRDQLSPKRLALPRSAVEGAARYLSGAFVELVSWWLDAPSGLSAAEVDELFQGLSAGALRAVSKAR